MQPTHICTVTNDNGVPFNVVMKTDTRTHKLLVFFDDRYHSAPQWKDHGQQVASYRLQTLLDDAEKLSVTGLCLNGGVPDWYVTGLNMQEIFTAVAKQLNLEVTP